ncbi:MAG: leucine-rich repeat protein, partial [Clostridia bacterium]|nr:leucine-rich repeat protein [Clostridia bacterium]
SLDAYYPKDTTVEFETSNESIVKIDAFGNVTAVAEGFASVTVKVLLDGQSTYYSETVSVEVKDPYITTGPSLTHYYGLGGQVDIPERLSLTEIGQFAFSNFEYILKTPEELEFDDAETSKAWYIGDNTITKVVIPEGVKKINCYAFANLTALEEIVLPSTMESIEYGAFFGCTSLKKIACSGEHKLIIVSQNAFENCDLRGTLDLGSICVISDYAFAGNQKLEKVILPESVLSVGQYAFAGCKKLASVDVKAKKVKYGAYTFTGCESLKEFTVNSAVLPEGMFYECKQLQNVNIGADVKDIGAFAFRDTRIKEYTVASGNKAYKTGTSSYILSADGNKLVAVSPLTSGEFTEASIGNTKVTVIGKGAFSHNRKITSVDLPSVVTVGDYGLASNDFLVSVKLGNLKEIGEYGFFESGITELPSINAETSIGRYAFSHTQLTSVSIPDNAVIAEGTYSECQSLSEIVIGDNVQIGKYAFALNKDIAFKVVESEEYGKKVFKYEFTSPITSLTIGKNANIGENAFANAAKLESVALGEGAVIGKMAFYNNSSLKDIDLSKVKSFGDYAISGDVYYACLDENMSVAAVSPEGMYIYTYHGPQIEKIDISSAESIGEYSFSYCRQLNEIKIGEAIKEIPAYAFAGCDSLKTVNLNAIETIGKYAFMECGLESIDLSGAKLVDDYAFVSNRLLESVILNGEGSNVGEGAFAYCDPLNNVENLSASENIGDYAFAYVAITEIDLTGAVNVGINAFMKEEYTPVTVILGEKLKQLGDNPFAMCKLDPFKSTVKTTVNGHEIEVDSFTFDISDTVSVVDGSLYCKTVNGLELITYAGIDKNNVTVADDTVRITAMAFAGSDVTRVKMPYTTTAIGHKAFYMCKDLEIVIFGSYNMPIFEEEFDPTYYDTLEHIPGTGDYGTYTDPSGNEVAITGNGTVPYFMWNVTGGMYSNIFYGANFIDYVGYVDTKPIMVSPINGVGYDSYICDQYFGYRIEGPAAPDKITVAAINAIKLIPERVTLADKAIVQAARAAYDKIATLEQMALVSNYNDLVTAEQRIAALEPVVEEEIPVETESSSVIWWVFGLFIAAILAFIFIRNRKENKNEN